MNLFELLRTAKTEEDVKASYIRALGLEDSNVTRGAVDFQTSKIWAETKFDGDILDNAFIQLLHYVKKDYDLGKPLPVVLLTCDQDKAVVVLTEKIKPLLEDKTIQWLKTPSQVPNEFNPFSKQTILNLARVHAIHFIMASDWDSFIAKTKHAMNHGEIPQTPITPNNLKTVFDEWHEYIGQYLLTKDGRYPKEDDFSVLFFADIMHDGEHSVIPNYSATLIISPNSIHFHYNGQLYNNQELVKYYEFWAKFKRPPAEKHREYLLQRRDALLPPSDRIAKGAFYTPLKVVEKAYEYLDIALGDNWQEEYIVWDMCCGTGNLANYHNYPKNLYASTLDQSDIDSIDANRHLRGANMFQYDYLNDDVSYAGINYTDSGKVPKGLRDAIKNGKKLLVLINPPYAEASRNGENTNTGVAHTAMHDLMNNYGNARNELFTQFLARIQMEIPHAVVALFSTMKYVNSANFVDFRQQWQPTFKGGFIIHSQSFDDLKGDFPIGFCIWDQNQKQPITTIECDVFDKNVNLIGKKQFHNTQTSDFLNSWINRPRTNGIPTVPLKNAVDTATSNARVTTWSDNAIAYMVSAGNDFQQAQKLTMLLSTPFGNGNGFYVTKDNLWQAACTFTARRIIEHTWIKDRDQFTKPSKELSDEFKNDCLLWMLFNGSNLSASADGLKWNGKQWSIVNHFIPFTEKELGADGQFESDFMVKYLKDKTLSKEAQDVLNSGKDIWRQYFNTTFTRKEQEELKLNRQDVGWYQVRKALDKKADLSKLEEAYKALTKKLEPQIYEYGFLK